MEALLPPPVHVIESTMSRWVGLEQEVGDEVPKFFSGDWLDLISDAESVSRQALSARVRKRRRPRPDGSAARAEKLTMMCELSAARQALESAGLAPGDRNTFKRFKEPSTPTCSPKGAAFSRDDDCDPSPSVRSP